MPERTVSETLLESVSEVTHNTEFPSFNRLAIAPGVLDLNATVAGSLTLLRRLVGEDVTLTFALDPALWSVRAHASHVELILMSLVVNARDDMPGGGKLTIETANVEFADAADASRPRNYAMLTVREGEHGASPYRSAGRPGTQRAAEEVGLSTVWGIVRQSEGFVSIDSLPGGGTTVKVYLPAVALSAVSTTGYSTEPKDRRGETILLVEDDPSMRMLVRLSIASLGYTLLEAGDGPEALRLAEGHPCPIDLLMTDIVMPGMGGPEVAKRLTSKYPGLKVLYLSGYTEDTVGGSAEKQPHFLQKPFTPPSLASKVRAILDEW